MTKARDVSGTPDVVLASGTLTAAAALNISNAFTDTYRFYTLRQYFTTSTATYLSLRFREGTTDKNSSYVIMTKYGDTTTGGISNYDSQSSGTLVNVGETNTTIPETLNAEIFRPSATIGIVNFQAYDGNRNYHIFGTSRNSSMTNFNGLSIFPNAGTMTGYYILTGRRV